MATESREIEDAPQPVAKKKTGDGARAKRKAAKFEKLLEKLEANRGASQLVILNGTPDPDAISSAMALDYIGSLYDLDTVILTFHNVSHHENRALVKRLGINLNRYDEEQIDFSRFKFYSMVDSQKFTTPVDKQLKKAGVEFLAFIDHHREDAAGAPAFFVDVRSYVQSTATIFAEYLQALHPDGLTASDETHSRLATALMHGIRTDTGHFSTATRCDYTSAAFLSSAVDTQVIKLIEKKVLNPSMLTVLEAALVNRSVHDNFIFSHVGFLHGVDRDGIPQSAELLLQREGTDTVLVFGIVEEKTIDGSFRTNSETINPDEFLKGFLGASPESGQYYGGGNIQDRGGFQIPLGFFSMYEDKEQVYTMAREVIERSFLEYIGRALGKSSRPQRPANQHSEEKP